MDFEFFSRLLTGLLIWAAIFIVSIFIWKYSQKQQWLTNYRGLEEEYDSSLLSALLKIILYSFSFPVMALVWVGASSLVIVKPNWNFGLSVSVIVFNLILLGWLTIYPTYRLLKATAFLWAAEINVYVKEKYPLEYYESKPTNFKK